MTDDNTGSRTRTQIAEKQKISSMSILEKRGILVVLSSNFLGKSFIINTTKTTIGRSSDCEIIIDDPLVSKTHCQIIFEEDKKFYIKDLGSKNSTFLNEKVLKKNEHLIYGDRVIVGNTIMRFYLEEKLE